MSVTTLALDYETRSEADLRSVGLWNYMIHPSTQALMAAWSFNGGPVEQVDFTDGEKLPPEVHEAFTDPYVQKWSFNAAFERLATRKLLGVPTPVKGWRCSMALSFMRSFSGGLEQVGSQLGFPAHEVKDPIGTKLVKLFSMPQRTTKKQPLRWRDRDSDPYSWQEFLHYNKQDVVAEGKIKDYLIRFPVLDEEWDLYEIDQIINDRGLPVDIEFVRNGRDLAARRKVELMEMMREAARFSADQNPASNKQILPWLQERGYPFGDLQKATVRKVLAENEVGDKPGFLADDAVSVLKLRQQANRTSVRKLDAILYRVDERDHRLRHCFQFAGASRTNRWSGRGPQPQNLVRTPKMLETLPVLVAVTDAIREGNYDMLHLLADEPMGAVAGAMRSTFRAPPGYEFVVCDLSAIESAVIAWLAGCERLLNVFRSGRDPYKDFGVELYRKSYEHVTKDERGVCKPAVLGCFGADTLVLTDNGWKEIVKVTCADRVHDGVEFVQTDGVVDQGIKPVIDLFGVAATPDHEVLVAEKWEEAWAVGRNIQLGEQATSSALGLLRGAVETRTGVINCFMNANVGVEPLSGFTPNGWKLGGLNGVKTAGLSTELHRVRSDSGCPASTLNDWRLGIVRPSCDARTPQLTLEKVSRWVSAQWRSLSSTRLRWMAGMTRCWKLIESTICDTMKPGTSVSSHGAKIIGIKAQQCLLSSGVPGSVQLNFGSGSVPGSSGSVLSRGCCGAGRHRKRYSLTQKTQVFDLANCGPRHRFVIKTEIGPMIVHNCGFGLGGGKLRDGKKTGLAGYAEGMGVNLSFEEAARQVDLFRAVYPEIPALWKQLEDGCRAVVERGKEICVNGKLTLTMRSNFLTMQLPSGRLMFYHKPRIIEREFPKNDGGTYKKKMFTCMGKQQGTNKWTRINVGGHKQTENAVQSVARDVLALGMRKAHNYGFKLVGSVHDELIALRRKGDNYFTLDALKECMIEPVPWLAGLPLNAAGYVGELYRKD